MGTVVAPDDGGGLRDNAPEDEVGLGVAPAGVGLGDSPGKAAGVFRIESG